MNLPDDGKKLVLILTYTEKKLMLHLGRKDTFNEAIQMSRKHFKLKSNINFEIYTFPNNQQSTKEDLSEFEI